MDPARLRSLLAAVAVGEVTPEAAQRQLADLSFADLGFAKLDLHRELRSGLPEAVFAEGKRRAELAATARRLYDAHGRVLVTRLQPAQAEALAAELGGGVEPVGSVAVHERCGVLTAGPPHPSLPQDAGPIVLLAAGTSDLAIAEEAAVCAEWFGCAVERCWDVGVAGLHRLLSTLPVLRRARAVIAVAGMDGALAAAVAGLVTCPVIAVPTSVGYGASFSGLAPLLAMLTACAPGVGVVNIDNGFGAAVLAWRIVRPSPSAAGP